MRISIGQDKSCIVGMEENMKFKNWKKCLLGALLSVVATEICIVCLIFTFVWFC